MCSLWGCQDSLWPLPKGKTGTVLGRDGINSGEGTKRGQMLGSSGKRSPQIEKQEYQSPGEDWPMGVGLSSERESDPSTPYHALTPIQQRQGS